MKQRKRRRKRQEYHQRGSVRVRSSISTGAVDTFSLYLFFSPLVNPLFNILFFFPQMPRPHSCLHFSFSLSLLLILQGSSAVIHPGQATIPYKANGSPHLASYFHIRSAVTDRVYTGSSLECEAAFSFSCATNLAALSPCSRAQTWANLLLSPRLSLSPPLLVFLPSFPVFSQLHLPLIRRHPSVF